MKIYTKTGDSGTTGLFAGPRVNKDHPRIQSYGTVDELNALLGVVDASLPAELSSATGDDMNEKNVSQLIKDIQSDLFAIGAQLATPAPEEQGMCLLTEERVVCLEKWIDSAESQLSPLKNFVLPGGSMGSAMLHLARTVCRRAERDIVSLSREPDVHSCELLVVYLNRLSDLLFVLARLVNSRAGVPDLPWIRPR